MAIIVMIISAILVSVLVFYLTVEQQKYKRAEAQEGDFCSNSGDKCTIIIPDLDLGQTSSESGILEIQNPLNLPSPRQHELPETVKEGEPVKTTADHQIPDAAMSPRLQMPPLHTMRAESEAAILKTGRMIAGLVISVSTTGIVSFVVGVSGNQSSSTVPVKKLHYKAVIFSMCASLFSALILLILSTHHPNFSYWTLTVRIIIWISTGLMTLGVVLLITLYFHME